MSPNERESRISVTKTEILRFELAISARLAEKRPPSIPQWAWKAEIDGMASILADLREELLLLEQKSP